MLHRPCITIVAVSIWCALLTGCSSVGTNISVGERLEVRQINLLLDDWHNAASRADEKDYFRAIADNGIFMGTDATEHWTKADFLAYAKPFFDRGRGWTFTPHDRTVQLSVCGKVAWFDELLDSDSYGLCRGSGVIELAGNDPATPRIAQYHLTVPVPNDLIDDVVRQIRASKANGTN